MRGNEDDLPIGAKKLEELVSVPLFYNKNIRSLTENIEKKRSSSVRGCACAREGVIYTL